MTRTPNYVLSDDFHISGDKNLPAGSFVRPIRWEYLPKHITHSKLYEGIEPIGVLFCYTRYGIVPIDIRRFRQI